MRAPQHTPQHEVVDHEPARGSARTRAGPPAGSAGRLLAPDRPGRARPRLRRTTHPPPRDRSGGLDDRGRRPSIFPRCTASSGACARTCAGLSLHYSNGPTEGADTKVELLKRRVRTGWVPATPPADPAQLRCATSLVPEPLIGQTLAPHREPTRLQTPPCTAPRHDEQRLLVVAALKLLLH